MSGKRRLVSRTWDEWERDLYSGGVIPGRRAPWDYAIQVLLTGGPVELSLEARAVLAALLLVVEERPRADAEQVTRAMRELDQAGYLVRLEDGTYDICMALLEGTASYAK